MKGMEAKVEAEDLNIQPVKAQSSEVCMSNDGAQAFHLTEALERVEGDTDLLREMIDIFLEECPRMLADVEHAVAASDPKALHHAAHALKGSVSNFAAPGAATASFTLEKMGRQQKLTQAAAALTTLKMCNFILRESK